MRRRLRLSTNGHRHGRSRVQHDRGQPCATRRGGLVRAAAAGVILLAGFAASGMVAATPASANQPLQLSASPNTVILCSPDTRSTTTLSWDVRGTVNDSAYLWGDAGTGTYNLLGQVHDVGSQLAPVFYTGHANFFALSLTSPAASYYPTIEVNVQQQPCPGSGSSSETLVPTKFVSSLKYYHHDSSDVWCGGIPPLGGGALDDHGLAPSDDLMTLGNRLAVGYYHYFDSGNDPLPCTSQYDEFYRGGVGFDTTAITAFINNHGLTSAKLKFRQDSGTQPCIDHIGTNSDPAWDTLTSGGIDVLPDGSPQTNPLMAPATGGGFWGTADESGTLGLALIFDGGTIDPHLHFVFVGTNEDIYAQDNNACESTISSLVLQLNGDH
jgi:hypothetical protein